MTRVGFEDLDRSQFTRIECIETPDVTMSGAKHRMVLMASQSSSVKGMIAVVSSLNVMGVVKGWFFCAEDSQCTV
jgi:hypothetical protein